MRDSTKTPAAHENELGFTLIELMATIVIVGVLALVSTMGYRKLILSSKMAEANSMVNAIRVAQEGYRSETGSYMNLSTNLATNSATNSSSCYPAAPTGKVKTGWGAACGSKCANSQEWTTLAVQVDGPVQFGYTTIAGAAGVAVPGSATLSINGNTVTWPADTSAAPWYIIAALGDLDANGTDYSTVVGTSWSNGLMTDGDGH